MTLPRALTSLAASLAGVLKYDFRPAVQPVPLLREGARRAREAVFAECTTSGSAEVDRSVGEAS